MKSKFLSIVCACALALTAMSSFIVAEAATPELSLSLNFSATGETLSDENYDEEYNYEDYHGAPVYKAELTLKGAAKKTPVKEDGTIVAFTGCFVDSIQSKFAYTTSKDVVVVNYSAIGGLLTKTSESGVLTATWSSATEFLKEDTLLVTWYFVAKDKSEITDMTISAYPGYVQLGQVNQFWDGTSKTAETAIEIKNIPVVGYPAKSSTPAVKGNTVYGFDSFMTPTAIEMKDDLKVKITNDKDTSKTIEETIEKNDSVVGGKTYVLPIVRYTPSATLGGSVFTVEINGTTYTYTVPAFTSAE